MRKKGNPGREKSKGIIRTYTELYEYFPNTNNQSDPRSRNNCHGSDMGTKLRRLYS